MQELTNIEKMERNKRVAKKIGRGALYVLGIISEFAGSNRSNHDWNSRRSNHNWDYDKLSAEQEHNMDSNGLSRAEAIRSPNW